MEQSARSRRVLRFGVFEVDLRLGELRKNALKLKLQDQPFQVLALLLERPGDLISREELRKKLWPHDTFVDFDHGINLAIYKLREALCDSAEKPRFIETLDRRGYRFIGKVDGGAGMNPTPTPPPTLKPETAPPPLGLPQQQSKGKAATTGGLNWVSLLAWISAAGIALLAAYFAWKLVAGRLPSTAPQGKIMLAVLPYENLSGDPQQEYFSDGLTDETIAQLGGLDPERLGVIARTSAMKYKHTNKDVQQIGRELGVQYLLEGTVRRAGDRVRITAQLIQVSDQTHLLAETYERDLGDIFALQSDVAKAVADKIQIQLTAPQRARLATPKPVKREAHEAYLRGRFFWNKRYEAEDWVKKSAEYFQEAIQEDPKFALAYAGLADYYNLLGSNGVDAMPPREARPKARAAAERALELDDSLAEAHTSLASILSAYDWNFQKAEEEFKRAMKLNANYATAHYWYSANLIAMGRLDEAIAESKRAQELDPLSLIVNLDLAWKYYLVRQYDQAIEQCRKTMELDPNLYLTDYILGIALEQKKDYPKAIFELQRGVSLSKTSPIMLMALGHAQAVSGNAAEVRKSLEELKKLSKQRYVPAVYLAAVYTGLGDKDRAFEWLEKAVDERSDQLINLNVEPMADSLRSDPRYKELIHRIGLPP